MLSEPSVSFCAFRGFRGEAKRAVPKNAVALTPFPTNAVPTTILHPGAYPDSYPPAIPRTTFRIDRGAADKSVRG